MAGITLSGLSSGLDTDSLIAGLMQIEQAPRTRLARQQTAAHARQDALRAVSDKLKALKTASDDLSSFLTWNPVQTATVSDTTKATAAISAGAGPGTYSFNVTQLATAEQRTYTYAPKASSQTYTLNGKSLTITGNEALDDIVSTINNDATYGVYAVNSNGSLVLASRTTGTAGAITMSGGGGNVLNEDTTKLRAAKNATYTIDGTSYTSSSNTISSTSGATGFVFGADVTLQAAGTFSVNVSPPQVDQAAVQNKVKAFVDAYNAATDLMRADLTEKRVSNPKTDADAKKGTLYGDDTLTDLMSQMRFTISTTMQAGNPAAYDELVEMGISTGASTGGATFSQDAVNGKLVLDTAKLTDALTKDPTSVQRLLGGITGTNGFAQSFSSTLDPYTQTGGLLDGRIDSAGTEITDLTDSIARMDDRLSQKEQSLRTMFTNLEVALQKAKSQGQELLSHLGISNDS